MATRYEKIINASGDFISLINRDYRYEFVNESYCREIGIPVENIMGKTVAEVWGEEKFASRLKPLLDKCFAGMEPQDIDRFRFGEGYRYIHVSYYPYREDNIITHVMIYSHDISAIKELESRLIDFEFKDSTTGLFNRKSFDIVLDMELEKARRAQPGALRAILFVNLRDFTQINARHGCEVGDLILESTGIRIKEALRASDYVFRFEGKELAIILTTMKRGTDLAIVAGNIRASTAFPYHHKGTEIQVGCNIGASIYPVDGDGKADLVAFAMSAMNEAKERDEPFVMFNKELHRESLRKARMRSDIRKALVEEQFDIHFQPIVDAAGGILGAEALIRWKHPELGSVPPCDFMPLAEETGETIMIGRWVLFRVCKFMKRVAALLGGRFISVNLSSREFGGDGLVEYLEGVLKTEGVDPRSLKLEITETRSMADIEDAVDRIHRLAGIGIDVYVDDFGAGYSSLSCIKRLPVKIIKIDRCFTENIAEDEDDRRFIAGMIGMIGSKGKTVLVSGVSDRKQYETLRALGVDRMQGFFFSLPMGADAFEDLLVMGGTLPLAAIDPRSAALRER
ncbi:MAG: EAL domain-containing protein [Spirochaetes bacterium]|nr:EAL domain-containing protein [Spirochaetota bacterium]